MTLDMTTGRPLKLILRFAFPLMLASILQMLYTTFDSLIVGRLLGTEAFAAVGAAATLYGFPISIVSGGASAYGISLAHRFGAKDPEGFRQNVAASLCLTLITALLFFIPGQLLQPKLLNLLNTPAELHPLSSAYIRILWIGLIISAFFNVFSAALRASGDSRTSFLALLFSTVLNIVLDYVLIRFMHAGVRGAAIATILAQIASTLFCYYKLKKYKGMLPEKKDFRLKRNVVTPLLRLSLPHMLCDAVTASGGLFLQAAINRVGTDFIAGNLASSRYYELMNVIGGGLEGASATFTGQNYGANAFPRIRKGMHCTALVGLSASVLILIPVEIFTVPMIRFILPDATAETMAIGVQALRVEAAFLPCLYLLCEYRAATLGLGNTILPMFTGFAELLMRLFAIFVLEKNFGPQGLYYAVPAGWALAFLLIIISFYAVYRKKASAYGAAASRR